MNGKISWTKEYCGLSYVEGLPGKRRLDQTKHTITLRRFYDFFTLEHWVYDDQGSRKVEEGRGSQEECKKRGETIARKIFSLYE
jgi:hypothetical protein